MLLTTQDQQVILFQEEWFQVFPSSQRWIMMRIYCISIHVFFVNDIKQENTFRFPHFSSTVTTSNFGMIIPLLHLSYKSSNDINSCEKMGNCEVLQVFKAWLTTNWPQTHFHMQTRGKLSSRVPTIVNGEVFVKQLNSGCVLTVKLLGSTNDNGLSPGRRQAIIWNSDG